MKQLPHIFTFEFRTASITLDQLGSNLVLTPSDFSLEFGSSFNNIFVVGVDVSCYQNGPAGVTAPIVKSLVLVPTLNTATIPAPQPTTVGATVQATSIVARVFEQAKANEGYVQCPTGFYIPELWGNLNRNTNIAGEVYGTLTLTYYLESQVLLN